MFNPTINFRNSYMYSKSFRSSSQPKERIDSGYSESNQVRFEEKLLKQNNNLIIAVACLAIATWTKVGLDLLTKNAKKINNTNSSVIKNFISLKDNKTVPTIDTCKSINSDLKNILERQIRYIEAGEDLISETGEPKSANRLLLCGSAGVGKSFFAKIFAKSLDAEYKEVLYSDFNSKSIGQHTENLTLIFKNILNEAKPNPNKKYVVVFNELDTLLTPIQKLSDVNNKGNYGPFKIEERSIFLNYLEGLREKAPNVIIIGTTNILPQSKSLDQAALSRFQNIIEVPYPDEKCIFEALKMNLEYLKNKDSFFADNKDALKELAQKMANRKCSFRNLEFIINEAKNIHLQEKIKNKNCEFSIDFLKKGEQNLKFSEGELDSSI